MPLRVSRLFMVCVVLVAGCTESRPLMPTPNIYADEKATLFKELPEEYANTHVELFYVTDRAPETDRTVSQTYGYGRSASLAAGTTVVDLGHNLTWDDLIKASLTASRVSTVNLRLVSTRELARLPPTPMPYKVIDGKVIDDPEAEAAVRISAARLLAEIRRRLALTPRKDVYIYIHGYNNTFADAAFTLAELWHFLGREGLPIVYTWPAGFPGLFGYSYDRESSEFTVFHLKQLIRWLSEQPEIENIHLIAHSRGTDVVLSALRELVIAARAAGRDPRESLRIKNLVLAAADLDLEVINQRVAAERLAIAVERATLYASPNDQAIGIAEWLFSGRRGRLGTYSFDKLDEEEVWRMKATADHLTIVSFEGQQASGYGHDYFRTNAAVSSDLILTLRYGFEAGVAERPLEHLGLNFWRVPNGYPGNAPLQ